MAKQLIECVPNFSEGRRKDVIEAIVEPFKKQKGCYLFDYRADEDHNRLVVSLAGEPQPICDAVLEASRIAMQHIDMNTHQGAHPRIGAIDVIPFTPISNITMEECVELARKFGERYYNELKIPVYYYEEAALRPERTRLEVIRKGQYEALKEEVTNPERHPDVGEPKLHPTAGATVIGARKFLIAFNVNLNTTDVNIAKTIAKRVRASGGGFTAVKGIGLALEEKGLVQVSMNIVDYDKTAIYRVLEFIRMEAARWGVTINGTEVYGMIPAAALIQSAEYYLQIDDFDPSQVLELKLLELMREED
ncbi:glutamate formiminotransferase [Thermovirga lienii DSM 17291]|jgi:glutamate formiminotransferase|uniref:glutamate formimidoyltransferase n=1 Tax=Thermovirga lienii (strain ATCC BAA-1197 / DSM 17291 / Cas60314) TaxID=580340 RepID=G7V776_THELD|nr:glutamate formimidoyltransferase [Thermovirga lienii]AER66110.1 glutamate formiminotransferase [Thermovirga lienii DSM 17291]MDN5318749.1 glutamate formiminotransferase / 5-formyltetrahydrofolate cyclo-ligase [Thermovirga sp.]MDN5367693.1 glutamate formiminotransferase / 5-formyltetrahydrofolate cyclo-ligase [Thermovirga sp.]HCD71834.1 glutamate formimidoyltransferase [Thermovirga lienii]